MHEATCIAHPNIALIKYWGNRDDGLRIPANGSISITLDGLHTRTTVHYDAALEEDELVINGNLADEEARVRVSQHLDRIRALAGSDRRAQVISESNFPTGAGLASSAAAFAALTVAASEAAGLVLDPPARSRLARKGSGSAARSILGGYVELLAGETDADSVAVQLADPEHWDLVDIIAIVAQGLKPVGSTRGHSFAPTSPLQEARVNDAPRRLALCRQSIRAREFDQLAPLVELDSDLMHAVMMTSSPPLMYLHPDTVRVMRAVREWRRRGLGVCYTLDAGPNIHCLTLPEHASEVTERLKELVPGLAIMTGRPGGAPRLL
jgi:diphosphomevalonate decarboxylase